jgi:hypothetical protein
MPATNLFIGVTVGPSPYKHTDISISTTTTVGADIELRVNATDAGSVNITRKAIIEALEAFDMVVNSNGIYTTSLGI